MTAEVYEPSNTTGFYSDFELLAGRLRSPLATPCWTGTSLYQRERLDLARQFYSALPASDPSYIPRPDGTASPYDYGYAMNPVDDRPGNSRAFDGLFRTFLTQQYFLGNLSVVFVKGSLEALLTVSIADEASQPVTGGAGVNVSFEIRPSLQSFSFPGAPGRPPEGCATPVRRLSSRPRSKDGHPLCCRLGLLCIHGLLRGTGGSPGRWPLPAPRRWDSVGRQHVPGRGKPADRCPRGAV